MKIFVVTCDEGPDGKYQMKEQKEHKVDDEYRDDDYVWIFGVRVSLAPLFIALLAPFLIVLDEEIAFHEHFDYE